MSNTFDTLQRRTPTEEPHAAPRARRSKHARLGAVLCLILIAGSVASCALVQNVVCIPARVANSSCGPSN